MRRDGDTGFTIALGVALLTLAVSCVDAPRVEAAGAAGSGHRAHLSAPLRGGAPTPTAKHHKTRAKKTKHRQTQHVARAPVTLRVHVGYQGSYRTTAWAPVRISIHNRSDQTLRGSLEIPAGSYVQGPPQPYSALYQTDVVLPAATTKQVTLYVPGATIGSVLRVHFREDNGAVASATSYPVGFDYSEFTIGVLTSDPSALSWARTISASELSTDVRPLSPDTLDPLPQVLANFDVIVLADSSTSRLDGAQWTTLEQYVRAGGALVLVGGPSWQQTLRPIPAALLPGQLAGTTTVPNLLGLQAVQRVSPPKHEAPTTISVLHPSGGTTLATQNRIPLAVLDHLGRGSVLYLAFDPGLDPMAHWGAAGSLLTRLFSQAAPAAVSRSAMPNGMPPPVFFGPFGPADIASELANIPAAALPSILLFVFLTGLYVLLLGPANFLILRRLGRRELSWITIPALAVLCLGSTFGVAFHLKGNTVLLNTVGVIRLDSASDPAGAGYQVADTMYVGLFAPVRSDYQLQYRGDALPVMVPQLTYYGPGPGSQTGPLGLRFDEGPQTSVRFLSMNMWSTRSIALNTTVSIGGTVRSQLHVDARGDIVGAVHNDTGLTLIRPVVVAGQRVIHLPDMAPEATVPVRIQPLDDIFNPVNQPMWFKMYGQPMFGCCYGGPIAVSSGMFFGPGPSSPMAIKVMGGGMGCCWGGGVTPEHSIADRIRNVLSRLPEAQDTSGMSEVFFAAWTEHSFGSFSVDGASPQRRDLTLITAPLSVYFPHGRKFHLRTGVIGAHLVDISPVQAQNGCCCCSPTSSPIALGVGGWATFAFDLPRAHRLHFDSLRLYVNAGGNDGSNVGSVYDWQARQWVHVNLSSGFANLKNPDRFVSPQDTVLVKLEAKDDQYSFNSNDVHISDLRQALQLSGAGVAT